MTTEKTLDEALDYMDQWGEELAKALEMLSHEQIVAYFRQVKTRQEELHGSVQIGPASLGTKITPTQPIEAK